MRTTKEEAAQTRQDIIDAARRVFHQCGVVRSTMEKIAKEAGVTRGAVYWHFENKAKLFFAMREHVFELMIAPIDQVVLPIQFKDPLAAVEAALNEFFRVLQESPIVRELFEIMISRCEYVDEFASVQEELGRPGQEFLEKIQRIYEQAVFVGQMRKGLTPLDMARDTWAFTTGLLHLLVNCPKDLNLYELIPGMITAHMALRRT